MRKLFRFEYEPCNGTCYHYCDILPGELRKLSEEARQELVKLMVRAHNSLCDNPNYSFGVDLDETNGLFVAHFRTPEKTDLNSSKSFSECVFEVCQKVLGTNIPKIDGSCVFGDNGAESLGEKILKECADEAFSKAEHKACPCKEQVA